MTSTHSKSRVFLPRLWSPQLHLRHAFYNQEREPVPISITDPLEGDMFLSSRQLGGVGMRGFSCSYTPTNPHCKSNEHRCNAELGLSAAEGVIALCFCNACIIYNDVYSCLFPRDQVYACRMVQSNIVSMQWYVESIMQSCPVQFITVVSIHSNCIYCMIQEPYKYNTKLYVQSSCWDSVECTG